MREVTAYAAAPYSRQGRELLREIVRGLREEGKAVEVLDDIKALFRDKSGRAWMRPGWAVIPAGVLSSRPWYRTVDNGEQLWAKRCALEGDVVILKSGYRVVLQHQRFVSTFDEEVRP